jgi:hypothetical protein
MIRKRDENSIQRFLTEPYEKDTKEKKDKKYFICQNGEVYLFSKRQLRLSLRG